MGKTKTAFVSDIQKSEKSSKQKYEEKITRKKAQGQENKDIERTENVNTESKKTEDKSKPKETRTRGKKYIEAKQKFTLSKIYKLPEAVKLIKDITYSSFDGTMEFHMTVKKHPLSVNVALPHTFGKEKKIVVANDKILAELESGKISFDILLATPDMMPKLVKFAKTLGPKGLMPNPKNGTIIKSVSDAKKFSSNKKTIKTEKEAPLIHTSFGKVSMDDQKLIDNAETIFKALGGNKQIVKAFIKSTMSPSVKITL